MRAGRDGVDNGVPDLATAMSLSQNVKQTLRSGRGAR